MSEKSIKQVSGRAIALHGNDIDTDRIIPARFLKEITFRNMGEYPFFDERFDAEGQKKSHPFNDEARQGASILVANDNFGCGSSREHAPQALHRWGIKGILAESLAEIFAGNCAMIGLPAAVLPPADIKEIQVAVEKDAALEIELDLQNAKVTCGDKSYGMDIPETRRLALCEGYWDSTALLLERLDQARETARSLPYMSRFKG